AQPRACLALGPLDGEAALQAAQAALQRAGVPVGEWQDRASEQAGVWAVATIRLTTKDFQARKEETYKKLRISYDYLPGPPEEQPTLVLSRHPSAQAADAALEALSQRALKGLRVMQLQAPQKQHRLVFAQADGALQARLQGLRDAALSPGFKPCEAAVSAPAAAAASAGAAGSATAAPTTVPASTPAAVAVASAPPAASKPPAKPASTAASGH
ncbi:MAG: hypothetical protein ABW005_05520, partial [Burkholderiaceae bacterium]